MKNSKRIFFGSILLLILLGDGLNHLSHCKNSIDSNNKRLFELSIHVLPDIVEIKVHNLNGPMRLNENLIIEKRSDAEHKWIFAACPLWFCGTKETVFSRNLEAGEISIVRWKKKLHRNCQIATAGKYRVLIKEHGGRLLAEPVEFLIAE